MKEEKKALRVVSKTPCQMNRGELSRFPRNRRHQPIAYHLCCPHCGFANTIFKSRSQIITESEDGEEVSFSRPIRCVFCKKAMLVTHSIAVAVEGPNVYG